ncbi:hypothetical protein, partial [Sinorhizobium psoraleae]|uniref:hypothetical protein n=1 Tax=Sinorhizobium psoraleae TaxID=520838 RepID=UPI001AEF3232
DRAYRPAPFPQSTAIFKKSSKKHNTLKSLHNFMNSGKSRRNAPQMGEKNVDRPVKFPVAASLPPNGAFFPLHRRFPAAAKDC